MKTHFITLLILVACLATAWAGPPPFKKARNDLERAHSIVTALQEGGKGGIGKSKATLPNLVTALSDAELSLAAETTSKGTSRNVALKYIAEARALLNQGKAGSAELDATKVSIQQALKRLAK